LSRLRGFLAAGAIHRGDPEDFARPWALSCGGDVIARGIANRVESSSGVVVRPMDEGIELLSTLGGATTFIMQFEAESA
jgi:hypothetical protein